MRKSARKFITLFSLFAITAGAFFAAFAPEKNDVPAEKIYCPLTKQFQPVHPPKPSVRKISLDDLCADDRKKDQLEQALFETQNLLSAGDVQFEKLAFDFFQIGKKAFKVSRICPISRCKIQQNILIRSLPREILINEFHWAKSNQKASIFLKIRVRRPFDPRQDLIFKSSGN